MGTSATTGIFRQSAGRPISHGDRIFVRMVGTRYNTALIAEMTLTDVSDMSEIYGELRRHTRGRRGLTKLYVRNMSRGWSFEQPFMLYADRGPSPSPAASVTHQLKQPEAAASGSRRQIPESVRLRYSM